MRAARFHPGDGLRMEDVAQPTVGPGELLVEVAACGVCRSDLHVMDGDLPLVEPQVLGNEVAGTVAETGEGVDLEALERLRERLEADEIEGRGVVVPSEWEFRRMGSERSGTSKGQRPDLGVWTSPTSRSGTTTRRGSPPPGRSSPTASFSG
jgi:hypothetical protein